MDITIRPEGAADSDAVSALLRLAFPDEDVAGLVELSRAGRGYVPELALVAVAEPDSAASGASGPSAEIVGYVMVTSTPVYAAGAVTAGAMAGGTKIGGAKTGDAMCVAPLAVHPDRQRAGIGRALVERAAQTARDRGEPVLLLEGDPAYYRHLGFVPAEPLGFERPSPTIPDGAYQALVLDPDGLATGPRGRVRYPEPFWAVGGAGLPEPVEPDGVYSVPWLFTFARYAGWIEARLTGADLAAETPTCPGWSLGDLAEHIGTYCGLAAGWIRGGRRPRAVAKRDGQDLLDWYGRRWRDLYAALADGHPTRPTATWSPYETTLGFWRRRTVHEFAMHAIDAGVAWNVDDRVALDGIDEVLRLFLCRRAGRDPGRIGQLVRVTSGGRSWTVGLNAGVLEVHSLPEPAEPDATLTGAPADLYRWLWNRVGDEAVTFGGDGAAIEVLRDCLRRATG